MALTLTAQNFDDEVLKSDVPVLVDFWAEWCGPCKMIGPVLEEIDNERDDVVIAKMNIDENPEVPTSFGVRSIPTLIIVKGGEVVATTMGAKPKGALDSWINESI